MDELTQKGKFLLDKLTSLGADCAQVSVSKGRLEEFNVDSGEFSLIRSVFNASAAMKAIKDNKKGSAAVNDLSEEALSDAAAECMELALSGKPDPCFTVASFTENRDFSDGNLNCDKEKFFDNIIRFIKQTGEEFPKIMLEQVIASYSSGRHVLMNTNGVHYSEEDGNYSISIMFSAHDGGNTGSFNCVGFDFLEPDADIMETAGTRDAFIRAVKELEAVKPEEKFCGTAVIMPQCLYDFTDIIFGFTGTTALIEKTSPWCGKLGQKVADECFTMNIIPRDKRIVGGENITSDGYISENYTLINRGVLESYSIGEYGSLKTGYPRAKASSGAVEIVPGEKTLGEIIAGIDRGILVGRFSGGEPGANGDFSGVAKNSFIIENGKIGPAIKETMISGNLTKMLNDIRGISKETLNDSSSILPWIAFGGITVS